MRCGVLCELLQVQARAQLRHMALGGSLQHTWTPYSCSWLHAWLCMPKHDWTEFRLEADSSEWPRSTTSNGTVQNGIHAQQQHMCCQQALQRAACLANVTSASRQADRLALQAVQPDPGVCCCPAQIANALNYIHKKRIVHRDLKTQNIFVANGGIIKLGDFGIAKVGRQQRRVVQQLHTVALSFCASRQGRCCRVSARSCRKL